MPLSYFFLFIMMKGKYIKARRIGVRVNISARTQVSINIKSQLDFIKYLS
jgi:hypothetical protein